MHKCRSFCLRALVVGLLFGGILSPAAAGAPLKLVNAPRVPLTAAIGSSIVATPGTWSASVRRSYSWLLNGKLIRGQTAAKIKLAPAYDGGSLQVQETVLTSDGRRASARSQKLLVGRLIVSGEPLISFVAPGSRELVVAAPAVEPANALVRYVWLRNGFDIEGAKGPKYVLTAADKGATIAVQVSFSRDGYIGQMLESNVIDIPNTPTNYALMWSDEFNAAAGSLPDSRFWSAQDGDGRGYIPGAGWGNAERQYYVGSLAQQDGAGNLVVTAKRSGADAYSCWYNAPCEWVSAKYVTQEKLGMKYGRVDIRMKATTGAGTWPAFWLLGIDFTINTVRWPNCGELDVVELLGREPRTVHGTTHGPLSGGKGRGGSTLLAEDFSKDFHVYRMDWTTNQITFFVDDKPYYTVDKSDADWVFDHEFFFLLNLAMGGNWGGPIDPAMTSASMTVDYIRVYSIDGLGEVLRHT